MDPQTVMIGIAIFILSALLIYFIAAITMREKTFEEVMAEQKKRQEEEREKIKSDKKLEKEQLKKKYKKGKGDKSKEKSAQVSEPELKDSPKAQQKEHKMVNLEIEPEIIEPMESSPLATSKVRQRTNVQKKSILHNKDESTPVTEKAVELPHKPIKPLDDVELKKMHDIQAQESSPKKEKRGQPPQTELRPEVKEVKVQKVKAAPVETVDVQHAAALEEKKPIKSKSSAGAEASHLIDTMRTVTLTEQEAQTLIEILLNRQAVAAATPESWNKKSQKGDPLAALKKQLEEKEKAFQEEQQQAMSYSNRVKELKNELTAERTKLSSLDMHFQEKMSQHRVELEALQARMMQAHEQHVMETSKMQAHIQQLEKSGDSALQKLKQENRILQDSLSKASVETVPMAEVNNLRQKVAIMEKELSSNAVRLNSSENAKKTYEDKLKKYEDQIRKLEASKGSQEAQAKTVEDLKSELRKAESKNGGLTVDLKKATTVLKSVETDCSALKLRLQEMEKQVSASEANRDVGAKLQESERKKQELEGNMKNLEKQLRDAVQGHADMNSQIKESERKKMELEGNMKNLESQLADFERQQDCMKEELQRVRQENTTLAQEVKKAKETLLTQETAASATNGDINSVGTTSKDKDLIHVSEHDRIVSEKVTELARVQSELEIQRSSLSQVTELKSQLDAQKQKNNELREKNWKAMEALEKAEKSAAEKVDKSLKSSRENVTKAVSEVEKMDKQVLKRLFPTVSVNDRLDHKEWVISFEKQVAQHLSRTSSSEKSMSDKVGELEEKNCRLEADVEVFKNSVAVLHSEKSRVAELEKENKKLQQLSDSYERQITELKGDRERLAQVQEENERLQKSTSSADSSSLSEEVCRLQGENQELYSQVVEKDNTITEAEKKLKHLERVVETEEKKWKEKLQQAKSVNKEPDCSSRQKVLEELTIQQQAQIDHYRKVLSNTENVLVRLESSEKSWEEKLQACQTDLHNANSQCQQLQAELKAASNNTQMQSRVESLERELRQSTDRLQLLDKERQELTSKVIVLETQSKAVVQVDNEDLRKELESLRVLIQEEQKKSKNLSSTVVRLNGIIRTGQDALTQEQRLVSQLQEQLAEKNKVPAGNGITM